MVNMGDADWDSKQLDAAIHKNRQDKRTNRLATIAVAMTSSLLPSCMCRSPCWLSVSGVHRNVVTKS